MGGNPETELQREIVDALGAEGWMVMRLNSGGRIGRVQLLPKGTPDLLALPPQGAQCGSLWIEVKLPGNEPTRVQRDMHTDLRMRGERVATVTSANAAVGIVRGLVETHG